MGFGRFGRLVKQTVTEWSADSASSRAAALAFYAALSISPLLIIAISIAGLVFGPDHVRGQIIGQVQQLVGPSGAEVIDSMLRSTNSTSGGIIATSIGLATLLLGAGGVFVELQDALNHFWRVDPPEGTGASDFVRNRLLSFAMVLGIGFLMLVSLLLSAVIAALGGFVTGLLPSFQLTAQIINAVLPLGIITVLFALIYKVLPNVQLHWRDVWVGAFTTAALFTIGKFLIGFYLGRASTASPYGAAGSVIVILLWVYYSALIVYFGAEFTKVYAREHGSHHLKYGSDSELAASNRPARERSNGPDHHVDH